MTLKGSISFDADPLVTSVKGMTMQVGLFNVYTDNIGFADTPGYQRKIPVVNTFAEQLGMKGVDIVKDTSVGRIHHTTQPLDMALNTPGYFQKLMADGRVEMTRDGRTKINKDGVLVSNDDLPILSRQGTPIVFKTVPSDLKHVKISTDGWIEVLNPTTLKSEKIGQVGVATEKGDLASDVEIRQAYVEESNVFLHEEFVGMVVPKRAFQANRQLFLTTSQVLSRLIQEMGRAQ